MARSASPDEATALFDEQFYLSRYPGVADAVKKGLFASGLQHYELFGEHERRVTSKETHDARRDLMLGFCSLGKNCEFGIAQRVFGAEPMDLLRWAFTPSDVLIRLLQVGFERIGDPNEMDVYPTPAGEYHIRHKGYQFAWHAWVNVGETTPEQIKDREVKRLPFLARKLMDDLAQGTRIFVVTQPDMTPDGAMEILTAMHAYGRPTLMYATQGGPPRVVRESDYLFHATIPKFADEAAVPATLPSVDWLAVCEHAQAVRESGAG